MAFLVDGPVVALILGGSGVPAFPVGRASAVSVPAMSVRRVLPWILVTLAAWGCLAAWSLASPPGSSPDDDYHMASIWCADGFEAGRCEAGDTDDVRVVPTRASGASLCYATDPSASAACQDAFPDSGADYPAVHGNWTGAYPPLYYEFMSTFVGVDVPRAIVVMRLVASALAVGLVALLAGLLPRRRRPLATVPLLLTSIPLGMSLLPSTNPSGWTILGIATLWPALYVAFETRGPRQWGLAAVAVLSATLASGARADGCLFAAMSVVLVLMLRVRHLRTSPVLVAASLVALGISAYYFLSAGQAVVINGDMRAAETAAAVLTKWQLVMVNTGALPVLWLGSFAAGPMGRAGWLDTGFPQLVPVLVIAVWFLVVAQGLRRMFPAKALGVGLVVAALFVHPLYLLVQTHVLVGEAVQPRYLLPLLVLLTGLVLLAPRGVALRLTPAGLWAAVAALGIAHSLALHVQMRRYISGQDVSWLRLGRQQEWWWDGLPTPTLFWLVGSACFVAVTWAVLRPLVAAPSTAPSPAATDHAHEGRHAEERV